MSRIDENVLWAVIEQSYNAVVVTDGSFDDDGPSIVFANPAFCRMTGYEETELIGRNPRIMQGPDTDPEVIDGLRKALKAGIFWEGETVNYRKGGRPYHVRWNISPVRGDDGSIDYFVSVQRDVTAEVEARRDRRLFASALDVATDAIAILDHEGRIVVANRTLARLSGHDPDELVGEPLDETLVPDLGADAGTTWRERLDRDEALQEVAELRTASGEEAYIEVRIAPVPGSDEDDAAYVLVGSDVTERVAAERELRDQALRDDLTGLLNRRGCAPVLERLEAAASERPGSVVAILADIDRFKRVNDTFGHAVGDRILVSVAETLQRTSRHGDTVVRWGGEEFLILLDDVPVEAGRRLAERLREKVADLEDPDAGRVTASFGVAAAGADDTSASLIERADAALYEAKESGRDRVVVAPPTD